MSFLINPFAFAVAGGDFESIATVTGDGSSRIVSFTSIPGTYKHLQLRCIMQTPAGSTYEGTLTELNFNGDYGSNYSRHELRGDGSSAGTSATASTTTGSVGRAARSPNIATSIIDILDYADTSKNTVARTFSGYDLNGSGRVMIWSTAWYNTAAVTTIALEQDTTFGHPFTTNSVFALYGVKA